ncbi:MAG: hypothetical protein WBA41_13080, partial [Rivularia sp. (in: cyanobacteria)]
DRTTPPFDLMPSTNFRIEPVLPKQFPNAPTIMQVEESPQTTSETEPAPQPQQCQCEQKPDRRSPRARW